MPDINNIQKACKLACREYEAGQPTPLKRAEIGQKLAMQFPDYTFCVEPHREYPNKIIIVVKCNDEECYSA